MDSAYQIVQFHRRDALVDTRDDFLGNGCCVDMLRVQAITKAGNTGCDFVELDSLLAIVYQVSRQS